MDVAFGQLPNQGAVEEAVLELLVNGAQPIWRAA